MGDMIQVAERGEAEGIRLIFDTTGAGIKVVSNDVKVKRVTATGSHPLGDILVQGANAHVEDITSIAPNYSSVVVDSALGATLVDVSSSASVNGAGIRLTSAHHAAVLGLYSINDEHSLLAEDSDHLIISGVRSVTSDSEAVMVDNCHYGDWEVAVTQPGHHGFHVTDSSHNRFGGTILDAGVDTDDTYDGVLLDGDSDLNRTAFTIAYAGAGNQMRYGLNIADATCNTNIEASLLIGSGATGAYNDSGTDTRTTDDHIVS